VVSDRGVVILLGVVVLGLSTQVVSLWTVQIMVVPVIIFLVLFVLLLRGPVTKDKAGPRSERDARCHQPRLR
jgi:hypothetical protein